MSMEDTEQRAVLANGQHPAAPVRVGFGPGKTQNVPIEWAEFMLNHMYDTQKSNAKPKQFGDLLALAAMEAK